MTLTPEEQIQTNLAAILRTVTGVKIAYERAPMSIPAQELPAAVTFPGKASPGEFTGPTWLELERIFYLRVYVTPTQAGEVGNAESKAIPYISLVRAKILAYPAVKAAGVWSDMKYESDSGVAVLSYAGEQFLGVEHQVRIRYRVHYTYAAGE